MPNLDKTGPNGQGPMTGRGMGNCSGSNKTKPVGRGLGFGRNQGRGRGRFSALYGDFSCPKSDS